jgi:hypothetical protein
MAQTKSVIVTITDDGLKDITEIARKLTEHGMIVQQVLPITGVISGICSSASKAALGKIHGVHSVEDDVQVQLAPPDSEIQ